MRTQYDRVAKILHWCVALLVIGMLILGFYMGDASKAIKGDLYTWHKGIGIIILALMILRLIWRFTHPAPAYPDSMPSWQKAAARINHFLLYALLIAMPLSGWLMSSLYGYYPKILGIALPLPVAINKSLGSAIGDVHEWLAWAIIVVVSIHVLAAVKHLFSRDGVFKRMW